MYFCACLRYMLSCLKNRFAQKIGFGFTLFLFCIDVQFCINFNFFSRSFWHLNECVFLVTSVETWKKEEKTTINWHLQKHVCTNRFVCANWIFFFCLTKNIYYHWSGWSTTWFKIKNVNSVAINKSDACSSWLKND